MSILYILFFKLIIPIFLLFCVISTLVYLAEVLDRKDSDKD